MPRFSLFICLMTFSQFDDLHAMRHEPAMLQRCLEALGAPTEFAWLWRAARLQHFMGMQAQESGEMAHALKNFSAGAKAAALAESQESTRVEGTFWRAVCDLEVARLRGKAAAGFTLGAAEKRINRAAAMDEAFHYAGPVRVQGRILHLKPLIMGGSLDRALTFYDRALQLFPHNSTTLLYRADALLADRQPVVARKTIHVILDLKDVPGWVWETARDKKLAREWLSTRLD